MSNTERFGTFYSPWPVIDGKPLNLQWGEIRQNHAETKALVRGTFQELQEGQDSLNAIRALLGQAYGDISFRNRYRFYYDKTTREFCLQKNDGTVDTPVWVDTWCVRFSDGQFQVTSEGGIHSNSGFYGPGLENIYQIGETGTDGTESFLHRSKLFFNTDDGFELNEITSGGNQGGVEVRIAQQFGRAQEFTGSGKAWVIEHNFGVAPYLVQVMDTDHRIIIPDTADVSDPNTAYFYFNQPFTGKVYIATGGVGAVELLPRDPFYLVVRTNTDQAKGHLMHPNAEVIFDAAQFYVNVDLDEEHGGAWQRAFVKIRPEAIRAFFYVQGVTAAQGDRNISATVESQTIVNVRLQPKLGGMKGFYFNNGDNIYPGSSIHFDVSGQDRMIIGKDGVHVTDKVKAEAFYLENGGNIFGNPDYTPNSIRVDTDFLAINDFDTGLEHSTNVDGDVLVLTAGSASNLRVTTTGVELANGTSSAPSLNFQGSKTSGLYRTADGFGLSVQGREAAAFGRNGVNFMDGVEAPGFYLEPGANNVGFDLSVATLEIHIPSAAVQPYFLVNFTPQPFIVDDVVMACQSGSAVFGFYIIEANRVMPTGIGIVGHGKDGLTLAEFYVAPYVRSVTATSANVVRAGESLAMICNQNSGAINIRGRVKVKLSG